MTVGLNGGVEGLELAFFLKISERVGDGRVFDGGEDDGGRRSWVCVQAAVEEPQECGIIGFGSAGGEGEFVGMGAEERGGFLACIVPCSASESAEAVATFRVPAGQKVWLHGFKNAWIEGSGGVGVEVDQGILFIRKSRFWTVLTHDFTGNCGTNPLSGWG